MFNLLQVLTLNLQYKRDTSFNSNIQVKEVLLSKLHLLVCYLSLKSLAMKGTYGGSAPSTPNSQITNTISDVIYSLVIQFGVSSIYASIPPIHIPYLANWSQTMEQPPKNGIHGVVHLTF